MRYYRNANNAFVMYYYHIEIVTSFPRKLNLNYIFFNDKVIMDLNVRCFSPCYSFYLKKIEIKPKMRHYFADTIKHCAMKLIDLKIYENRFIQP